MDAGYDCPCTHTLKIVDKKKGPVRPLFFNWLEHPAVSRRQTILP